MSERSTVLIVDDDPIIGEFISEVLRIDGHVSQTVGTGTEALSCLETQAPDLVLLDGELPDMHGIAVLQRIRATPETAQLPVIVITGHDQFNDRVHALAEGANDFLLKPVSAAELRARVQLQIRLRASEREAARKRSELAALAKLATTIADTRADADFVERSLSAICQATRATSGALFLRGGLTYGLVCTCTHGFDEEHRKLTYGRLFAMPEVDHLRRDAWCEGDVRAHAQPGDDLLREVYRSYVTVGILAGPQPIGILALGSTEVGHFSTTMGEFLSGIAGGLATVLDRIQGQLVNEALNQARAKPLLANGLYSAFGLRLEPMDSADPPFSHLLEREYSLMQALRHLDALAALHPVTDPEAQIELKLAPFTRELAQMLRDRFKDKCKDVVDLAIDIPEDLSLFAHPEDISEILTAVITNALEALERGGTLMISGCREPRAITLMIYDSGPGITDSVRRRCFEPFFTTKGKEHLGLGLTFARQLARLYNGTVTITSAPAAGTVVTLRFPPSS